VSKFLLNIIISAQNNASATISSIGTTAQTSFGRASAAITSAYHSVTAFTKNLFTLGSQIGMTIFGIQALYNAIVSIGSGFVSGNASMEQMQIAFEGLLKSESAAKKLMADMWDFAAKTPFEFPQLAASSRLLLAFGFNLESIIPMMRDIGDTVAGLGGGSFEIDRVVRALGQMQAKGKIAAQEMMQMAELGIPAWDMLAKGLGKTTAETMKMSELGLIPADKAIRILLDGMHQTFGGQMQRQSMTFNGLLSTFKDNVSAAWRSFTGPLFIKAKDALIELGNVVTSPAFQSLAKDWGENVGEGINKAVRAAKWLISAIKDITGNADKLNVVKAILTTVGIIAAWAFLSWAFAAAQAAIMTIAATWPILVIIAAIALLAFGIFELITHWNDVTAALGRFKDKVGEIAGVIGRFIGGVFSQLGTIARGIADSLGSLGSTIGKAVGGALNTAKNTIGKVLYSILAFIVGLFALAFETIMAIPAIKKIIALFTLIINQIISTVQKGLWFLQFIFDQSMKVIGFLVSVAMSLIHTYIVDPIQNAWNFVSGIFVGFGTWVADWFSTQIANFGGWLKDIGKSIADGAGNAVDTVKKNVVDPITDTFNTMIKSATDWGANLISNFINGIKSKWDDFVGILGKIKDKGNDILQGKSPPPGWPEQGTWGPTLVNNLVNGIERNLPLLDRTLSQVQMHLTPSLPSSSPAQASSAPIPMLTTSAAGPVSIYANFPNATSREEIEAAFYSLQRKQYKEAQQPGFGQGFLSR
jgi:tape measure domain-containing protein